MEFSYQSSRQIREDSFLSMPVLLLLPLFFLFSFTGGGENCKVHYNGIYNASVDDETDAHIRFYEDGTVIVSTSVKNIKDVSTWFTKENSNRVLKGKYKLKGCAVKFKVKGDTGEQFFEGTVNETSLQMQITNGGSKAQVTRTYQFVQL